MDADDALFSPRESPRGRSTPRSEASSPANSNASLNLNSQSNNDLSLSQSADSFHRMGMFFQHHAQHMHQLNQIGQMGLDVMKGLRMGSNNANAVSSTMQGPRHTIDAILGLNGNRRQMVRQDMDEYDCRNTRESSIGRSLTPGAGESAGKSDVV
jgi:hypothetical protein